VLLDNFSPYCSLSNPNFIFIQEFLMGPHILPRSVANARQSATTGAKHVGKHYHKQKKMLQVPE
jgi:hypothetical protein